MIGFLPLPAGEDPLAGFPSDGLAALYKCDERVGDQCFDAAGKWPPLRVKSGVALDMTANDATNYLAVTDSTGFVAAIDALPAYAVFGAEFIAPAASATSNYIIGKAGATNGPIQMYLAQTGAGWRVRTQLSTVIGAGALTTMLFDTPTSTSSGAIRILPETYNQLVVYADAITKTGIIYHRSKPTGPWSILAVAGSGSQTAGANVFKATGTAGVRLFDANGAKPFTGKAMAAFVAVVGSDFDTDSCMQVFDRQNATHLRNLLGSTARFWSIREGTGTVCRELITAAPNAIDENGTATAAWTANLTGCHQPAMRQGTPYYGRPGLRIGGEASYAPAAYAETEDTSVDSFGSSDGWTFGVMLRVGDRDPASATQALAQLLQANIADFTTYAAAATAPGVGITLTTAQSINAVACRSNADTRYTGAIGAGNNDRENGLLTYYSIVCPPSTTTVSLYRQNIEDTEPELVGTLSTASTAVLTACNKLTIGNASFDTDAIVGFVSLYTRPLATGELAQCFRAAYTRMVGEYLYVDSGYGITGNGTENAPYSTLLSALRAAQKDQEISIAAGEYSYLLDSSSVLRPASVDGIALRGASRATTSMIGGAGVTTTYPLTATLATADYTFSGITFDAAGYHSYAGFIDDTCGPIQFLACAFTGGKANTVSVGSGCLNRAASAIFADVQSYDNEEHGIYNRISDVAQDGSTVSMQDIYCYGNTEDGIKNSAEGAGDGRWRNCSFDRIRIAGGNNLISFMGVDGFTATNMILEAQVGVSDSYGAIKLGHTDLPADNGEIANVTIYGCNLAIWNNIAAETVKLRNIICDECTKDLITTAVTGLATITYSAGESATDPIPDISTNIAAATIALVDPANVDASLRDFNLDTGSDGIGVGANLYSLSEYLQSDYGETARPATGAWNMGAF